MKLRKPSEGTVAIGALIGFAFWLFVALPVLIPQRYSTENAAPQHYSTEKAKDGDVAKTLGQRLAIIWNRTWDDPVAFYTFVLSIFTGLLAGVSAVQIGFLALLAVYP